MRSAATTTQLPTTRAPTRPRTLSTVTDPGSVDGYITYMVVPPDGGWGWVIVAASFFANMLEGAVIYSIGSYTKSFTNEFAASSSAVALVGSLLSGFHQLVGPLVGAMSNRWGFRIVMVVGSITSAVGVALCSLASELWHLYLLFGLVAGIGTCMIYMPGAVIVSFYFVRWRALAVCLSLCGAGAGGAVFPAVLDAWIACYGWRSGTLFEGGLLLSGVFAGLLYRPIKPVAIRVNDAQGRGSGSGQLTRGSFLANDRYPTAADAYSVSRATLHSLPPGREQSALSIMMVPMEYYDNPVRDAGSDYMMVHEGPRRRGRRCRKCLARWCCCHKGRRRGFLGMRPMYRDDIFYHGSVKSMRSRMSHGSLAPAGPAPGTAEYTMTVTRLPSARDIEQEESRRCILCPEAVTRILATMLDCSLLRSSSFLLLALQGCLVQAVLLIPFIYAEEHARLVGVDPEVSKYLVGLVSGSGTLLRIVCGVLASIPRVSVFCISSFGLATGGVALLVAGLSPETGLQIAVSVCFGGALACFFSLRSIVIVELLGLEKLTNAFGLLLLFQGTASVVGPPLAGAVKDMTGHFHSLYYIAGTCLLLSSMTMACLPWVNRRERARHAAKRAARGVL